MKKNIYLPVLMAMVSLNSVNCLAQSQGPNKPDTAFNVTFPRSSAWKNPLNAKDSDKIYATDSLYGAAERSDFLEATGFNFSIPSNATITGITVQVLGHDTTRAVITMFNYADMVKNGVILKDSIAGIGLTTTDRWQTLGGCSNMWDTTWTYSDINASNFGVAYFARLTVLALTGYAKISIDAIRVTVCYTIPTSTEIYSQTSYSGRIYPNPSRGLIALPYQGKYLLQVYDITGKEVFTSTLQGAQNIDLSFLANGMYLMHITSGNESVVRKLVLQK